MKLQDIVDIIIACTSLVSLFVAVKAVRISTQTTKAQIQHNVLSMLPICEIFTAHFPQCIIVEIKNKGLGLMQINDVVFTDKQGIKHEQLLHCVDKKSTIFDHLVQQTYLKRQKVIMPGEFLYLAEIRDFSIEQAQNILDELSGIKVLIEYSDVYSNRYHFSYVVEFILQ